jgi:hypothetical protein
MTPQLLNDEQYNIKTASAALRRHLPQLFNDEQYNLIYLSWTRGSFGLQHELHKSAQFTGVTAPFTGVNTANEAQ